MKYLILFLLASACASKPPALSVPHLIKLPAGLVVPDSGIRVATGRILPLPDLPEYGEYLPDIPDLPAVSWPSLFAGKRTKIKNSPVTLVLGDGNQVSDVGKVKPKTTSNDMKWLIWIGGFLVLAGLVYVLVRTYVKKPP